MTSLMLRKEVLKKLLIEDIYYNGVDTLIPNNIPQFIQSTEWWSVFTEYFDELLLQLKGGYPLNLPRLKDYSDISKVVSEIGVIIRFHLVSHFYEYDGLYKTTQFEYNPIWNVDGTVKTEGTRNNESANSTERKLNDVTSKSGNDIDTLSGSDVDKHSGTDTLTKSGEDVVNHSGSDTLNSDTTISETPMDSQAFLDKEKTVKSDTTEYGGKDTTEYGGRDTTEYGRIDSTEYGRKDTIEYNNTLTIKSEENVSNEGVDDEKYNELVTRQGNIGITSTQSLVLEERNVVSFSWLEYVVNDIAPRFTIIGGIYSL